MAKQTIHIKTTKVTKTRTKKSSSSKGNGHKRCKSCGRYM